jgi:hypothetical protein
MSNEAISAVPPSDAAVQTPANAADLQHAPDANATVDTTESASAPSLQVPAPTPFDFYAPLSGPANMKVLAHMMAERKIANDDVLQFTKEFVAQFYPDDGSPGEQCMFNGEPTVWGDPFWSFLFLLAYYYPAHPSDDVKRAAFATVQSLRFLLPCEHCRPEFRKEILETPIEEFLESRESFIEWVIEVRSNVDKRLGKPPFNTDAAYKRLLAREHTHDQQHSQASPAHATTVFTTAATPVHVATTTTAAQSSSSATKKVVASSNSSSHSKSSSGHEKRRAVKSNTAASSVHANHGAGTQVVQRADMLNHHSTKAAPAVQHLQQQRQQQQAAAAAQGKTTYGMNQIVTANDSLKTVRDAMSRNSKISMLQRANVQRNERAKEAQNVKKPAECKSCGKGKAMKPSVF